VLAELPAITVAALAVDAAEPSPAEPGDDKVTSLYVFEGELSVATDDRPVRAPAGSWVQCPSGADCAYAGTARFLELRVPA
jgi:quercetin dioxygenase-like cupin family protein